MKKLLTAALLLASFPAYGVEFNATIDGITDSGTIPEKFAHCVATDKEKSTEGQNISPKISWDKGPYGTRSFAIIVVDRDVPTKFDDAGKEGKTISATLPRQNFYHWILLNIPADVTSIAEGQGKKGIDGASNLVNDYLKFSGAEKTALNITKYTGYDGPCPPWNDELVHNYHFKVLALSNTIAVPEQYTGDELMQKLTPLILAEDDIIGTYTLNTALKKPEVSAEPKKEEPKKDAEPKKDTKE